MNVEPQKEHHWLQKLVGEWTYESECSMGPDQPASKFVGSEKVRSIGGLWVRGDMTGEMPGGGMATMVMTLGFDPLKKRFVGTFIGSMMTHLWIYDGGLNAEGTILTLDAVGPSFTAEATMVSYQDIIEFKSDDHRVLSSQCQGEDGKWTPFMKAHYRRTK